MAYLARVLLGEFPPMHRGMDPAKQLERPNMSLMSALNTAVSGLRTTQDGINLVGQNVANAGSVGYTRRAIAPVQQLSGANTTGVRTGEINRILDTMVQKQMHLERAGSAYANTRADVARSLDRLFGAPGSASALDTAMNAFTQALAGLASNPSDLAARTAVLGAGQTLAARLGAVATGVQTLRTDAEHRLDVAVKRSNELLDGIAELNGRMSAGSFGSENAALADERDRLIGELSQYMDLVRQDNPNGAVTLRTLSGQTLLDGVLAHRLAFTPRGALTPQMTADAEGGGELGRLMIVSPSGGRTDITATGAIRSGQIGALLEARDETLVQVQRQLDELALGMARAMSDVPASASAIPGGVTLGLPPSLDDNGIAALSTANYALNLDIGGTRITIMPDPPGEALTPAAVQTALQAYYQDADVQAAPQPRSWTITGLGNESVTASWTALSPGTDGATLPFFVDGGGQRPVTGAYVESRELAGLAQRLSVNVEILANPKLLAQGASLPAGETRRAQHALDALTATAITFSAQAQIGGMASPYEATVADFMRRIVEAQGANAEAAVRLAEGQAIALAAIESRFAEDAGVNIDREMATLIQLQTAYGANARIMTAVRDMMDVLMRM